jgi:hypothetical protein
VVSLAERAVAAAREEAATKSRQVASNLFSRTSTANGSVIRPVRSERRRWGQHVVSQAERAVAASREKTATKSRSQLSRSSSGSTGSHHDGRLNSKSTSSIAGSRWGQSDSLSSDAIRRAAVRLSYTVRGTDVLSVGNFSSSRVWGQHIIKLSEDRVLAARLCYE